MVAMLGKLQSIWRRYAVKVPETHAPDTPLDTGIVTGEITPNPDTKPPKMGPTPITRAQRLTADVNVLRGDMRTLESKIDSLKSRSDRFDQAIAGSPSKSNDMTALSEGLSALRDKVEETEQRIGQTDASAQALAHELEALRDANEAALERMQRQNDRITGVEERIEDLAKRIEHLQMAIQSAIETVNTAHIELVDRETARMRDLTGRIVGLYIIAGVALTVALATIIVVVARVGL